VKIWDIGIITVAKYIIYDIKIILKGAIWKRNYIQNLIE